MDAHYEKVRVDGQVIDVAVLIAYGVDLEGCRRILGISVELSEAEVHWKKLSRVFIDTWAAWHRADCQWRPQWLKAAEIRAVFNSEDLVEAEKKLEKLDAKYEEKNG